MNSSVQYDVVFYEAFEEEQVELKRFLPTSVRALFVNKTIQESSHSKPPASVISTRTQSTLPVSWASQGLKCIISRSTGYDHLVRYREATASVNPELQLGYLPMYCARSVAEHALMLWLSLLRRLPLLLARLPKRSFDRDGITGAECEGKKLVVCGVGNIGSIICRIGSALGMTVVGVDPVRKCPDLRYSESIDDEIPTADVVVCSMSLNRSNVGFFSRERLSRCRHGKTIFVNVARGEMSPCRTLLDLLNDGTLGGVGLDVYAAESELSVFLRSGAATPASSSKPPSDEVLATLELALHPKAILTPHNAFNSCEAVVRKSEQAARSVVDFVTKGNVTWTAPAE